MNPEAIAELDRRFGIPGVANVIEGNKGLAKVSIHTPSATGEMYLHGAHVTSWQLRGAAEVLFVSSKSHWEQDRAIRGGVPICFPWFGNNANNPSAHRRTDSYARWRGNSNQSYRPAMPLRSAWLPKVMTIQRSGGPMTFI